MRIKLFRTVILFCVLLLFTVAVILHHKLIYGYESSYPKLGRVRASAAGQPQGEPTLVLILGYMRGGTTFVGELLDQNPDAFYMYEPLYHIYVLATPNQLSLKYLNGSTRHPPTEQTRLIMAKDVLMSFYTCDFRNIDRKTLASRVKAPGVHFQQFLKCGGTHRTRCVQEFIDGCNNSSLRAIKTIRLRMSDIADLFDRLPSLKVVHLLRDPRGIIHSRIFMPRIRLELKSPHGLCDQILSDLSHYRTLEERYRHRVKQILYEEMAEDPVGRTHDLYSFLGTTVPENIIRWLQENTRSDSEDTNNRFSTKKRNSSDTAWKWRREIPWQVVQQTDEQCSDVYKQLGYMTFTSENDLRDMALPARNVTTWL